MNVRRGALGTTCALAMAASLGAFAATGWADVSPATYDYEPTLLGNSSYTNQDDARNAFTVEGTGYLSAIASQNADTVAEARSQKLTIGQDGEGVSPILVMNNTGKEIVGFTYKDTNDSSYQANLLPSAFEDGAKLGWFWKTVYDEARFENSAGASYVMPVNYTFELTFSDGETAELHNVNLNGVRTLEFCYSADYDVFYLNRTTITNHTPNRSLYYEVSLREDVESGAYTAEQIDQHINSSAALGTRMFTEARGQAWMHAGHGALPTFEDYGSETMLPGEPTGDFATAIYQELYWNSDNLIWRGWNNDLK